MDEQRTAGDSDPEGKEVSPDETTQATPGETPQASPPDQSETRPVPPPPPAIPSPPVAPYPEPAGVPGIPVGPETVAPGEMLPPSNLPPWRRAAPDEPFPDQAQQQAAGTAPEEIIRHTSAPPPLAQSTGAKSTGWPGQVLHEGVVYAPAGFWLRLSAFLIDVVILSLLHQLLLSLFGLPQPDLVAMLESLGVVFDDMLRNGLPSQYAMNQMAGWQSIVSFHGWMRVFMCAAYFTAFHGFTGATLGKLAVGIRVLRINGNRLGPLWALLRYLLYFLSAKLAYTAWVIPFDRQRRSLYDMIVGTNVYRPLQRIG